MSDTQSYWASFTLQTYNCAYAIMIWDTLLTLSKEKRKIWNREWSPMKVIFLFNRYYGIASMTVILCFYNIQVPTEECAKYVKAEPLVANFTIISYQSILLLRCYTVWLCDKRTLFCGVGMLICHFHTLAFTHLGKQYPLPITGEVGPCVVQGEKFWIASVFLFPTITDTILTIVTFARVFYIAPKNRSSVISRILFVLPKVLIVFVGNCANGILYLQPNRDISTIFSGFAIILGNICGNHLILATRHDGSVGSGSSESPRRTSTGRAGALSGRDIELDEVSPTKNSGGLPVNHSNQELFTPSATTP
ncbi:uncharacterized protein ARMOST_11187 [Armillaria ostoyae]|uniref:DUF6533 domain-containing protein n=1 Tax=Armillaria ostoyae TaxID=47428 RepID=A0A284RGF0_ARMOS|nr:uncharacterized protein ARMOST_11187 [Armillaria ostoyae]